MQKAFALLGKFLYYTAGVVALPIFLHNTQRARVAIIDPKTKRILLAKSWIGTQEWELIGGGAHKDEDFKIAAIREVAEETGVSIDQKDLRFVEQKPRKAFMSKYSEQLFVAYVDEFSFKKQTLEILDMAWLPVEQLPRNTNQNTRVFVNQLLGSS